MSNKVRLMKNKLLFLLFSNFYWFFIGFIKIFPESEVLSFFVLCIYFLISGILSTYIVRYKINIENSWFLGLISFFCGVFGFVLGIANS
jgi:hypothetical protein